MITAVVAITTVIIPEKKRQIRKVDYLMFHPTEGPSFVSRESFKIVWYSIGERTHSEKPEEE